MALSAVARALGGEAWAPIRLAGLRHYEASSLGRIRNKHLRILRPCRLSTGYLQVGLYPDKGVAKKRVQVLVHRAVASAFLKDWDETLTVDHIDKTPQNNALDNLRMATHSQQNFHRCHKNSGRGLRVPVHQLSLDTGEVVGAHASIKDAAAAVGARCGTLVGKCVAGAREAAHGFGWRYPPHVDLPGEDWKAFTAKIMVSNHGRYRRVLQNGLWSPAKTPGELCRSGGYPKIDGGTFLHVAVAKLFVARDDLCKRVVNHVDGDKLNAAAANLRWVTHAENTQHAHDTGLIRCRTRAVAQLLDGATVASFASVTEAARATGVNAGHISACCNGARRSAGGFRWAPAERGITS